VNATECPGGVFYATLPALRADVANRIGASTTTTSTSSTTTSTTAADTTPPTAPGALRATAGKRLITLAWTAATDSGSGVAGYEVFRSTKANGKYTIVATTTTNGYTNTGLSPRRTYWYYVKAYDGAGNRSAPSNTVSATAT
jgi:chitinase